jgi:glycosyltransferase involved in cell wall biosynthesis
MQKLFVIYYEFSNTSGNHAGTAYFAKYIKEYLPLKVVLIKIPNQLQSFQTRIQKIWRHLIKWYIFFSSGKDDVVFLMEYFGNAAASHQREIAIALRKIDYRNRIVGLVHLPGWQLNDFYGVDYLKEGANALDDIMVYGSSLRSFFADLGYENKIIQTYHYVDHNYYKPDPFKLLSQRLKVISIGTLNREFGKLQQIIQLCPEIDFTICMGKNELAELYSSFSNVSLIGFVPEDELLKLMQKADISLSVFKDTIGSNVITTSMACGLINVVSDVGSIRDYCTKEDSILCNKVDEFVVALNCLSSDRNLVEKLRGKSIQNSAKFNLEKIVGFIYENFHL